MLNRSLCSLPLIGTLNYSLQLCGSARSWRQNYRGIVGGHKTKRYQNSYCGRADITICHIQDHLADKLVKKSPQDYNKCKPVKRLMSLGNWVKSRILAMPKFWRVVPLPKKQSNPGTRQDINHFPDSRTVFWSKTDPENSLSDPLSPACDKRERS